MGRLLCPAPLLRHIQHWSCTQDKTCPVTSPVMQLLTVSLKPTCLSLNHLGSFPLAATGPLTIQSLTSSLIPSLPHPHTHPLKPSLAYPPTQTFTHSFTHSLKPSLSHLFTQTLSPLTHSHSLTHTLTLTHSPTHPLPKAYPRSAGCGVAGSSRLSSPWLDASNGRRVMSMSSMWVWFSSTA